MNSIRKSIAVRFFEIKIDEETKNKFIGSFKTLIKLSKGTDVVTSLNSRYIINCLEANDVSVPGHKLLFWSSVKERNTWQVRSTPNGKVSGLGDSNSIVGDISYYKYDPEKDILAAFTTCPSSGYLKPMCKAIFKRLTSESIEFEIDYLSDDDAISQVKKWDYYSKVSIKLDTNKIADGDEKPDIIKALMGIKDTFGGGEISITLGGGKDHLPKQDVIETVNYLSSSESCGSLSLSGGIEDGDEKFIPINLKKAFIKYRTTLELQPNQIYIDSTQSDKILTDAFANTPLKK